MCQLEGVIHIGNAKSAAVADPELSCRDGRHYGNCSMQGIGKEIDHYRRLIEANKQIDLIRAHAKNIRKNRFCRNMLYE